MSKITWVILAAVFVPLLPSAGQAAPPLKSPPALVAWQFDTRSRKDLAPQTDVFLRVDGRRVLILQNAEEPFQEVERQDYKSRTIPAQAIAACAGWWAGQGDELYVVRRAHSLVVFRKEEDEQAPVFPWKRLKVIPLHLH